MTTRKLSSRDLAVTTFDQAVSSASNFLFLVVLATSLPVNDFARSSTIWTVISFTVIVQRSVFGVPLLLDLDKQVKNVNQVGGVRFGSLVLGVPAVLIALFFVLGNNKPIYLLLALLIPLILLQDLGRYVAISRGKAKTALYSDLLLLLPIFSAIGVSIASENAVSASMALIAFAIGLSAATAVVFRGHLWNFSLGSLRNLIYQDGQRRKKLFIDSMLISGTAVGSLASVWVCFGSTGVAAFNGALTALAPIGLSTLVIQLVVQHGIVGSYGKVRSREVGIFLLLILLSILWIVFLVVAPSSKGVLLLGESWVLSVPLFTAMGFSLVSGLIIEFLIVALRAQGSFDQILTIRKLAISALPIAYVGAALVDVDLKYALYLLGCWGFALSVWVIGFMKPFIFGHTTPDINLK